MPDKPSGRGLHVQQSAVKRYALQAGLPVYQPEKLRDPAFVETFRSMKPDLGIVIAFRMLPEIIWAAPKLGTFNLHASLLPQYRGAAPINWALINGETETGVTTFLLNREIDKGAVLCQTRVPIGPDDDAGTLHDRLMEAGTELVVETIGKIAQGTVDGRRTADRRPGMPEGRSENIQGNVPYRLAAACRPDMQPDPGTEPVSGRVERAEPSGRNTGRSQNLPCESRSVSAGKGPRSHRNGRQVGNQSSLRGRLCPNRGAADRRTPAHDDRGIAPRIQRDRKLHLPIAGE